MSLHAGGQELVVNVVRDQGHLSDVAGGGDAGRRAGSLVLTCVGV